MRKWIIVLAFCVLNVQAVWAANLTAKLNRNPVPYGETVLLTISYDDNPQNSKPNFNPLSKDFVVYSIENSFSSTISNGKMSQNHDWIVAMSAKNEGEVIIPSLKLGASQTKPILLKVLSVDEAQKSGNVVERPKFSISRTIDVANPFVQQQINYNLVIKTTEALQASEPQFMGNAQNEWIIRSLGQPQMSAEIVDGVEVKKVEFSYALFPQKSGELIIPEVQFSGYYNDPSKTNQMLGGFFGMSQMGFDTILGSQTPVNLLAKSITVKVKSIPAENNGSWWLPASAVEIYSDWEGKNPSFKAGEATNREIYIKAVGIIDTQLPKIKFPQISGLKQYPEKPAYMNDIEGEAVVAVMKINNVYIPESAGNINIPEVAVNWYNVKSGKMEVAKLPAYSAVVVKGENVTEEPSLIGDEKSPPAQSAEQDSERSPWKLIALVFVAFLAGLGLAYFLFRPKREKPEKKVDEISNLKEKVKSSDIKGIRDSVISWAKKTYNDEGINNLNEVAAKCKNPHIEEQLELLNLALYSPHNAKDFDAKAFWEEFKLAEKQQKKRKKHEKLLPDLYK